MKSIRYIGAATASFVLCFGWVALAAVEKIDNNPPILFVQSASGASFKDGKLTLMSPSTIFFSDRPARLAGNMPCSSFIKAWSNGSENFKKDPPNAVLSVFVPNGEPKRMVVTLQNPRFEGSNLIYDGSILRGAAPEGVHEAALFIDDVRLSSRGWPGGDPSCLPEGGMFACSAN